MNATFDPDLRAYNAGVIKSCKVEDLPGDRSMFVLEPKYDGFRLVCHITPDGVESWTRSLKPQAGKIPYIDDELRSMFPRGTVVDGEIVALQQFSDPDSGELMVVNDFEHVQSVMLSKPEKAVAKAEAIRRLDYIVFDMTYDAGEDIRQLPFHERRTRLKQYFDRAALKPTHTSITTQYPAEQHIHDKLCEMGFEGTIAKHAEMPYKSGDRGAKKSENGRGQFKLKTQTEVDVVLISIKPGTPGSEFDGMVGALVFGHRRDQVPSDIDASKARVHVVDGVEYVERGNCSGVTLDERRRLTKMWKEEPDKLFGTVFAFKHMGKYPDGVTFRHPQFSRWREDKPIGEVVWHDA